MSTTVPPRKRLKAQSPTIALMGDKPLFIQLKDLLRLDILEHRLLPGQKLPSEAELTRTYGVSRITVRQALSELQAENLVETLNGKGSFVTRPGSLPSLGGLAGYYERMRATGQRAHGKLLSVKKIAISARAAKALKLPSKTIITRITMIRYLNDVPMVSCVFEMPHELAEKMLMLDMENEDAMRMLETRLNYRLDSIHLETSAVPAKVTEARHLNVPVDYPLLRISFVPHDLDGKPLVYSLMHFRTDQQPYTSVLKR